MSLTVFDPDSPYFDERAADHRQDALVERRDQADEDAGLGRCVFCGMFGPIDDTELDLCVGCGDRLRNAELRRCQICETPVDGWWFCHVEGETCADHRCTHQVCADDAREGR